MTSDETIETYTYNSRKVEITREFGSYMGYVDGEQISKRTSAEYAKKGAELYVDNQVFFETITQKLKTRGYEQLGDKPLYRDYYTFESPNGERRFKVENATDKFDTAYVYELTHAYHKPRVENGFINQASWGSSGKEWRSIPQFIKYVEENDF